MRPSLFLLLLSSLVIAGLAMPVLAQDLTPDDIRERARERERDRLQTDEQDAWTRAVLVRFQTRLEESDRLIGEVIERDEALRQRMQALLTDDAGKRLARNPAFAVQFNSLREQPIVRREDLRAHEAFLNQTLRHLRNAERSGETGYAPSAEHISKAEDAYLWARDRYARLVETEAWLDEAITAASDVDVSDDATLEDQIRAYLAARQKLFAEARLRGEEAARDETASRVEENARIVELERALQQTEQMLREARQQMARARVDFEAQIRAQEAESIERMASVQREYEDRVAAVRRETMLAEADRARLDAEAAARTRDIEADAKRIELVQRARSPQVQQDLKPFLAKGFWQPGDATARENLESRPMSFSRIQADGALDPSKQGLIQLVSIANATYVLGRRGPLYHPGGARPHIDDMRPKWAYPRNFDDVTNEQFREVQRIQALLRELGPTLVEEGLLDP